jgi:hypothetical protein
MKNAFFSIAQVLLLRTMGINPGTADANPMEYLKLIKDGTLYIKTDVITGGTGTVQLIDSNTRVVVGLSTFNSTQLRAGQTFLLEQIRFGVSEVASTTSTGAASQTYSVKVADCPLPLLGANLVIRQGGVTVIDIPVKRLLREAISPEKGVGQDGYYLASPKLLKPELETEISIRFPDAGAAVAYTTGKKQFLELLLMGPEAASNS